MTKNIAWFTAILFTIVLILGACGPEPATTSEPAPPTDAPTATMVPTVIPEAMPATEEILPSPTPAPTSELTCAGIFQKELILYPIPSDALEGEQLGAGAYVEITGELNEPVWYQIRLANRTGWALQAYVRKNDPECKAPQRNLATILSLQGSPILEDTFRDSNNWYLPSHPSKRAERLPNGVDNYTLNINGYDERISASAPVLENISSFELSTSYWRQNGGDSSSYVGIQYGNEEQYFEVHILGSCEIEVITSDGFYEKQITRNERNKCKDDISDLLFVNWDGSGTLYVQQNKTGEPYRFILGDSVPATGQIQLIAEAARVQFDFIAVTSK